MMSVDAKHPLVAAMEDHWHPDPASVALLPKETNKDARPEACDVCGGWHKPSRVHLEYVGHVDTARTLTEIDPDWSWEPFAVDEHGLPCEIERGRIVELWGRLTLLGKTVICVGSCETDKSDVAKELVGDLIRNGAMRHGIYGALWSKAERDANRRQDASRTRRRSSTRATSSNDAASQPATSQADRRQATLDKKRDALRERAAGLDGDARAEFTAYLTDQHISLKGRCDRNQLGAAEKFLNALLDGANGVEVGGSHTSDA
jgi:hypothetical protein